MLRVALARHPDQSAAEIVEQALAERGERESAGEPSVRVAQAKRLTAEDFDKWLDSFTQFSDKIPQMPGETFRRETIYQDHD